MIRMEKYIVENIEKLPVLFQSLHVMNFATESLKKTNPHFNSIKLDLYQTDFYLVLPFHKPISKIIKIESK